MDIIKSSEMIYYSLIALGVIGVFDEVYFHQIKGNILKRKECFFENILHLLRSYCFSAIFFYFAFLQFTGGFILILTSFFIIDLFVGTFDILEEQKSRDFQGGLNRFEYLTHMILSFHLGALYINLIPYLYDSFNKTSSVIFHLPTSLVGYVLSMLFIGAFIYSVYQTIILFRVNRR